MGQNENTLSVLKIAPGQHPQQVEIDNDLKALQQAVGGTIEMCIRDRAYGKHLKVFEQTIPRSVRAAETSAAGKSIFAYDPKGKVAEAYKSLAKTNY